MRSKRLHWPYDLQCASYTRCFIVETHKVLYKHPIIGHIGDVENEVDEVKAAALAVQTMVHHIRIIMKRVPSFHPRVMLQKR